MISTETTLAIGNNFVDLCGDITVGVSMVSCLVCLGRGQYGQIKCKDFQAFLGGAEGCDLLRLRVWSA